MKSKLLFAALMIVGIAFLSACGKSNYPSSSNSNETEVTPANPNSIPYTLAQNYFVRNSVQPNVTISKKIDTEMEFNQYFGVATTMNSSSTPINFSTHYVIAVVTPTTNRGTVLNIGNLTLYHDIITLSYTQSVGQVQSYSIRPSLIVVVDRKYDGEVLIVEK